MRLLDQREMGLLPQSRLSNRAEATGELLTDSSGQVQTYPVPSEALDEAAKSLETEAATV